MRISRLMAVAGAALACVAAAPKPGTKPFHFIAGGVYLDGRGPDGNSVILDAPKGLIVFDTGRHPAHASAILAFARTARKPIAAIVNSHWHLDHTTGNMDILAAYPHASIIASRAIEGRLFQDFIAPQRDRGRKALADGSAPADQAASLRRAQAFLDHPVFGRPSRPVERSGWMNIAGRKVDVRLARFAATEGDVWLLVPDEHLVVAGDLVVDIVPFMDTACVDGWSQALKEIAAVDFATLVPGHGAPMTKPQFLRWKAAFDSFVDCGRSALPKATCVDRWMSGAAPFIDQAHRKYAADAAAYYLDSRLRASAKERQRYCAVPSS